MLMHSYLEMAEFNILGEEMKAQYVAFANIMAQFICYSAFKFLISQKKNYICIFPVEHVCPNQSPSRLIQLWFNMQNVKESLV